MYDGRVAIVSSTHRPGRSLPRLFPAVCPAFARNCSTRDRAPSAVSQRFILGPRGRRASRRPLPCTCAAHANFAIGCASGTDAIWLALAAAGIGDSVAATRSATPDAVITSAVQLLRLGVSCDPPLPAPGLCFADIDPLNLQSYPQAASRRGHSALTPRNETVKAVLPVHLYGQCADWTSFQNLQNSNPSLVLIEDAAQAFGATWSFAVSPPRPPVPSETPPPSASTRQKTCRPSATRVS